MSELWGGERASGCEEAGVREGDTMKHRHSMRKLGRTSSHRWALLRFVCLCVCVFLSLSLSLSLSSSPYFPLICFVCLFLFSLYQGITLSGLEWIRALGHLACGFCSLYFFFFGIAKIR